MLTFNLISLLTQVNKTSIKLTVCSSSFHVKETEQFSILQMSKANNKYKKLITVFHTISVAAGKFKWRSRKKIPTLGERIMKQQLHVSGECQVLYG